MTYGNVAVIFVVISVVFSVLGAFSVRNSFADVGMALGFGVLGYAMVKLGYPTAPLVLALILTPMLENALRQSLGMAGGSPLIFVTRPISLTLLLVGAVLVGLALRPVISRSLDWRSRLPAES